MGSHPWLLSNHICSSVKPPARPSQSSREAMPSQLSDLGSAGYASWLMQILQMRAEHSGCDRQIWGIQEGSGGSEVAGAARQRQGLLSLSSLHPMPVSVPRRMAWALFRVSSHKGLPLVLGLTGLFPSCPQSLPRPLLLPLFPGK